MSVSKRILIVFLLLICFSFSCFANMPVIDVTAIATALMDYYEKITQWQAQLQQWQSEFDRIQKAAQGIANGDYMTVLSSVASLTTQMSTWNLNKTVFDNDFVDRALAATGDSTYSLINIISNAELLQANLNTVWKTIEQNVTKAQKINQTYGQTSEGGVVGSTAAASSNALNTTSNILNLIKTTLLSGSKTTSEIANIYNNLAELFNVTPEEYANLLREIQTETLYGSTNGTANAKTSTELRKYINTKEAEKARLQESLSKIGSDETTKKEQTQISINSLEEEIKKLEELEAWSRAMDTKIAEVEQNQASYEYAQSASERRQALLETQKSIEEYKNEVAKERADELVKLSEKYKKAANSYSN